MQSRVSDLFDRNKQDSKQSLHDMYVYQRNDKVLKPLFKVLSPLLISLGYPRDPNGSFLKIKGRNDNPRKIEPMAPQLTTKCHENFVDE